MAVCSTIVFGACRWHGGGPGLPELRQDERLPVQVHVDVTIRRRFESIDPGHRADVDGMDELLSDGARCLSQAARQLEGDRDGEVAECAARRTLDHEGWLVGGIDAIDPRDCVGESRAKHLVER